MTVMGVIRLLSCSGTLNGVQHLWFIPYILFCYFVTPYLCSIKNHLKHSTTVILVLFGLCVFSVTYWFLFNSFFRADRIICFIVGYFIGYIGKEKRTYKNIIFVASIIAVPMNLLRIAVNYIYKITFSGMDATVWNFFVYYAHAALGILLFLIMYLLFGDLKGSTLLDISDSYSYYVYLTHHIIILGPFSLLSLVPINGLNIVLVLVCTGLLTFGVKRISNHIKRLTILNYSK